MAVHWLGRCTLHLALLASLVALVPLAHAQLPDQTWIAGSYDAEDGDDAVTSAVSITAAAKSHRGSVELLSLAGEVAGLRVPRHCLASLAPDVPAAVPSAVRRNDSARSPPLHASASAH